MAGAEGGLCLSCLIRELLGLFVPLCPAHVCTQKGAETEGTCWVEAPLRHTHVGS